MKRRIFRVTVLAGFLVGSSAHAQFTANYQTNTISGVTSNWSGDYVVGSNTVFSSLQILNAAVLSNGNGLVGYLVSATNNSVRVTDPGSVWSNHWDVCVGWSGSVNQVMIDSGGVVVNNNGCLGVYQASSNNLLTVTGTGSVWSNASNLYVGLGGSGDRLVITNHGAVFSAFGYVGNNTGTTNNVVVISGSGSVWSNASDLFVGLGGSGNQLVITNGGAVYDRVGQVGNNTVSSSNLALVTGLGSVWNSSSNLYVGLGGSGNQLVITNGGAGSCWYGYVGNNNTSSGNFVTVTGVGSVWSNANVLAIGEFGSGNQLLIGTSGAVVSAAAYLGDQSGSTGNLVTVTGPGALWLNGSSLSIGNNGGGNRLAINNGGGISSQYVYLGGNYNCANNSVEVYGTGSVCAIQYSLYVGAYGPNNQLLIAHGGQVVGGGEVGYDVRASNNIAVVTDPGSLWSGSLFVGYSGSGNQLIVTNGGVVSGMMGAVGEYTGSNNVTLVSGTGSVWSNTSSLGVGTGLNYGNLLIVSNGGVAYAPSIICSGPSNNIILAGGALAGNNLQIGGISNTVSGYGTLSCGVLNQGLVDANVSGGTLSIAGAVQNRGTLRASNGGIIEFFGPVINFGTTNFAGGTAIFHGPILGGSGTTNSWVASGNGAWETAADWSLGTPAPDQTAILITNATTKTVTVSATTASVAPTSMVMVSTVLSAPAGSTNTLSIVNVGTNATFSTVTLDVGSGGRLEVSNATAVVGLGGSGTFTVEGAVEINHGVLRGDGVWLYIGSSNTTCRMVLTNGALVSTSGGYIFIGGFYLNPGSNSVMTISGAGSVWSNSSGSYLGGWSAGNRLEIIDGGAAITAGLTIGNSNIVLVAGSGSIWSNSNPVVFNQYGSQAVVTNGGRVFTPGCSIGANGSSNIVLISDPGSVWCDSGTLNIGAGNLYWFINNQLIITNGGSVYSVEGRIGGTVGTNNTALVTGSGSVWSNAGNLYVGYTTRYNQLVINDGGVVVASNAFVGRAACPACTNNLIRISDGSLFATAPAGTGGLEIYGGTLLLNTGTLAADRLVLTNGTRSIFTFTAGLLAAGSTTVTNTQPFIVGDGVQTATYQLNGGVHSFANALCISSNSQLTGCGTIQGFVVNNGTISTDCSLTFAGPVTNNSVIVGSGYNALVFSNQVVNNGTIDGSAGTLLQFVGGLVNNGTVKPVAAPAAPSNLTASPVGCTSVQLAWRDQAVNETGFALERSTNGVTFATLAGLPLNTTSYTDHSVTAGTTYYYRLCATNAAGASAYAGPVSVCTWSVLQAWQFQYFGCTNCPQAAPEADPLGKGMSNTNQFLLGLNPTNPASVFRIASAVPTGADFVVTWQTAGPRTNVVQATNGGLGGSYNTNFQDISGPIIISVTGDTTTNYTDVGGATNASAQFYRIRLGP
jgi:T5SS/PEP-CTERM-associated repeat protein